MERATVKLVVIPFILGVVIFLYTPIWGRDWKHYGTNEEGDYFYDAESMISPSRDIIRICVQSVYTDKGISQWVEKGGESFKDLDFSVSWLEIHCIEKSFRYLKIIFYTKKGEAFYPFDREEWHFFIPDAMLKTLFSEVCPLRDGRGEEI